jgi:uncharacterized peroxidase-related enzyme
MTYIDTTAPANASGELREMYLRQQQHFGYVPNYARVFAGRVDILDAWAALQSAIRRHIDDRSFELVTLAAALELGSSYCALAHGNVLAERYYTQAELKALLEDTRESPLTEAQKAMMRMARKVVRDPSSITAADHEELRSHGYTDLEIFDLVAAASARSFFSGLVDALGAEPDAAFMDMDDDLRQLLTVGREISGAAPAVVEPRISD